VVYFVAVILKVLLVNLLAALNFANVFFKNKKRLENKKKLLPKNVKKRFFTSMVSVVPCVRFPDGIIIIMLRGVCE